MEWHEKSYGSVDINIKTEWKLDVADLTPTYNWDFSGLFVCQYIHQILKGVRTPFFNNKIYAFASALSSAFFPATGGVNY